MGLGELCKVQGMVAWLSPWLVPWFGLLNEASFRTKARTRDKLPLGTLAKNAQARALGATQTGRARNGLAVGSKLLQPDCTFSVERVPDCIFSVGRCPRLFFSVGHLPAVDLSKNAVGNCLT